MLVFDHVEELLACNAIKDDCWDRNRMATSVHSTFFILVPEAFRNKLVRVVCDDQSLGAHLFNSASFFFISADAIVDKYEALPVHIVAVAHPL